MGFVPRAGDQVEIRARVSLYEPRGDYQLQVDAMRRAGLGNLYEAFLRLKEQLAFEGLFDPARKRELAPLPRAIGVITSLHAAALRDVLSALARRAPQVPVIIYPAPVQGADAAGRLAAQVRLANQRAEVDTLLLVRGGGSIEDLWSFNDEALAREVAASAIPVVSGVGHETDFTIVDFVADLRAPTPTAAAELACTPRGELLGRVMDAARTLARGQQRRLERAAQRLDRAAGQLVSPAQRLEHQRERLNSLGFRLASAWSAPQGARSARRLARATPGTSQARHAPRGRTRGERRAATGPGPRAAAPAGAQPAGRRRRAAARAGSRQYAGAGICDCPRRAGTHPARCRQPAARTGAGVAFRARRRAGRSHRGPAGVRRVLNRMPGPGRKRPVRQSLARQTHAAKSDCLARRRPAGRWNDRNAGLGRFGRGRRRAARPGPGAPGGQRGAGARAASARGAEGSGRDCDCQSPYRDYPKAETPEARALFEAARANDEAAFTAALAGVPHPGDYADDGRPLLHVLLMPPRVRSSMSIGTCRRTSSAPARRAPRRAAGAHAHAGGAAGHKPALNDATYQSRRTALQLALLYGSPQIVDMLLAAGADPNQAGDEGRKPLEFLLDRDFEFAVRMTYLPRLVDRPDMARMVQALLKAGAQRPFQGLDDAKPGGASALTDAAGEPRRMADFLSWNPLVELTEGGDVLRAFAATGTRPAFDNELSPLALAAYTGNAGAVPALMELVPRTVPATGYGEKACAMCGWMPRRRR